MLVGGAEGLIPASRARFESCCSKLPACPSANLSFSVEAIWCSVSNAMAPARERSAHLRYGELTLAFNAAEEAELCSRPGELRKEC